MPNPETELIAGELYIAYQHGWSTDEPTWAVLTSDEAKAAHLAARLGGRVKEAQSLAGAMEVLLDTNALEATLDVPTSLMYRSVQRRASATAQEDHVASVSETRSRADTPGGRARPCDQMVEARAGTGRRPEVSLLFRITGAEDLGAFRLTSKSWGFAESVRALSDESAPAGHLVRVMVRIETSRMTTRSGVAVVFVRPELVVLDPLPEDGHWCLAA